MKYTYETKTLQISGYSLEEELNKMAENGWRFIGFVPKSSYKTEDSYDGITLYKTAIFEKEKEIEGL